jgi:hypothetical protein
VGDARQGHGQGHGDGNGPHHGPRLDGLDDWGRGRLFGPRPGLALDQLGRAWVVVLSLIQPAARRALCICRWVKYHGKARPGPPYPHALQRMSPLGRRRHEHVLREWQCTHSRLPCVTTRTVN